MSDDLAAVSKRAGDEIVAALEAHDLADHDGERCVYEAINALAYLAHRIGLRADDAVRWGPLFYTRLLDYDALHAEHHHPDDDDASGGSARLL